MTKILGGVTTVLGLAVLALALLVVRGPKPEARGDEPAPVLKVGEEVKVSPRGEKAGGEEQKTAAPSQAKPDELTGIEKLLEAGDPDEIVKTVVFNKGRYAGKSKRVIILDVRGEVIPYVAFGIKTFPKGFQYGKPYKVRGKIGQYDDKDQFQISKFVQ